MDQGDGASSCTDGTEDFCDNPTRDSLTEGLVSLLKPTVDTLETSIKSTRYVQIHHSLHILSRI